MEFSKFLSRSGTKLPYILGKQFRYLLGFLAGPNTFETISQITKNISHFLWLVSQFLNTKCVFNKSRACLLGQVQTVVCSFSSCSQEAGPKAVSAQVPYKQYFHLLFRRVLRPRETISALNQPPNIHP